MSSTVIGTTKLVGGVTSRVGRVTSTGGVKTLVPYEPSCHPGVQNDMVPAAVEGEGFSTEAEKTDALIVNAAINSSELLNVKNAFFCVSFLMKDITGNNSFANIQMRPPNSR